MLDLFYGLMLLVYANTGYYLARKERSESQQGLKKTWENHAWFFMQMAYLPLAMAIAMLLKGLFFPGRYLAEKKGYYLEAPEPELVAARKELELDIDPFHKLEAGNPDKQDDSPKIITGGFNNQTTL